MVVVVVERLIRIDCIFEKVVKLNREWENLCGLIFEIVKI